MRKQIKIDDTGFIAIHDKEDEDSLYFIDEDNNRVIMELRKKYGDDKKNYPKEEVIVAHPIKEIANSKPGDVNHIIDINNKVTIPVFRMDYSWGIIG